MEIEALVSFRSQVLVLLSQLVDMVSQDVYSRAASDMSTPVARRLSDSPDRVSTSVFPKKTGDRTSMRPRLGPSYYYYYKKSAAMN